MRSIRLPMVFVTLELRVLGTADNTHPALAQLGQDLVVTDRPANHDRPILP